MRAQFKNNRRHKLSNTLVAMLEQICEDLGSDLAVCTEVCVFSDLRAPLDVSTEFVDTS
eukprot:TRINITY_DN16793_c0_g1_i1.p1 TRINITY_DN16793_c0_g1~~TRINITY_DN16793_c0_g1_i1.p1  ORF type:complete len:59 (+),score=11.71 TRINITY_DN16793_c0_g1_i1:38-214(+)